MDFLVHIELQSLRVDVGYRWPWRASKHEQHQPARGATKHTREYRQHSPTDENRGPTALPPRKLLASLFRKRSELCQRCAGSQSRRGRSGQATLCFHPRLTYNLGNPGARLTQSQHKAVRVINNQQRRGFDRGCREGSAVKSSRRSCRGPELRSQHQYQGLTTGSRRSAPSRPLLAIMVTALTYTCPYPDTHTYTIQRLFFFLSNL